MRCLGAGALILLVAAGGAQAQNPGRKAAAPDHFAPLSAAVFDVGKALPSERRSTEATIQRKGANDRIKLDLTGAMKGPDGLPVLRPSDDVAFEPDGFDVSVTRDWPSAVRLSAGESDLAITPHAGLALTEAGGGAQAGAEISLEDRVADRLEGLGVSDGERFGDRGRWYMFAGASGRTVGLNMLRGADGELQQAGWSADATSALISDAQAGVGWRRGAMQASLGYLHREIKPQNGLMGLESKDDELVAFTFSFKPR